MYKTDEEEKIPIFPNVFSRASGHPFLCVSRVGDRLEPREFRETTDDEETNDGYLFVGDDLWDLAEDAEMLPDSLFRITRSGMVPDNRQQRSSNPREGLLHVRGRGRDLRCEESPAVYVGGRSVVSGRRGLHGSRL